MAEDQKPPETGAQLAEQLAKLLPPEAIDKLRTLPPRLKEQLEKAAPALSALTVTRSNNYKAVYSNLYRTRMGANEVTLLFARMTHTPNILAVVNAVEEEFEVTMGWSQIKMLVKTLTEMITAFEQEVGTIPIPLSFQSSLEAQRQAVRNLGLSPAQGNAPIAHDTQQSPPREVTASPARGRARRQPVAKV
jgi:hypothetical protein